METWDHQAGNFFAIVSALILMFIVWRLVK